MRTHGNSCFSMTRQRALLLSAAFIVVPFVSLSLNGTFIRSKPSTEVQHHQYSSAGPVKRSKRPTLSDVIGDTEADITGDVHLLQDNSVKSSKRPLLDLTGHTKSDIKTSKRPPLSDLIGDNETDITGDVQFLLDFAILGHPKCGTDKQMRLVATHDEVQMYDHEVRSLRFRKPAELVSLLYALPEGDQYKRGYKAPRDIYLKPSLQALQTYWPKTKLIVGVRHPIKWFESYHNFRMRTWIGVDIPPAETMLGMHMPPEVRYHFNLAQMGKTNPLGNPIEANLLGLEKKPSDFSSLSMTNKVLLYESSQPFDKNRTRAEIYWKDLTNYIGLSKPLVPPKRKASRNKGYAIDICDDLYLEVRAELLEIGKAASEWIQSFFMVHQDVLVSSPEHFKEILNTWKEDPCDQIWSTETSNTSKTVVNAVQSSFRNLCCISFYSHSAWPGTSTGLWQTIWQKGNVVTSCFIT